MTQFTLQQCDPRWPSQTFCLCALRSGFMHERAYTLDWVEEIPEIMQLIPESRCPQSRLRCFVLYQLYKFWLSSSAPSTDPPAPQVSSASADKASIDSQFQSQHEQWQQMCFSGFMACLYLRLFLWGWASSRPSEQVVDWFVVTEVTFDAADLFVLPINLWLPGFPQFNLLLRLWNVTGASFGIQATVQMSWWHTVHPFPLLHLKPSVPPASVLLCCYLLCGLTHSCIAILFWFKLQLLQYSWFILFDVRL